MTKRIPQIEFLRVLAMVGVFFFHIWSVIPDAGTQNPLGPFLGDVLAQGYLGVVIFNTITGFVLALPLILKGGGLDMTLGEFFRRRFGRICPQYYMALVIWSAAALFTATAAGPPLWRCVAEHALFVHTLDPACFFSIVPAMWWMGLVAQFYLCFPFLLRFFNRVGPFRALACIMAGCFGGWSLLLVLAARFPEGPYGLWAYMIYFNLPARLPEFALGIFLAFRFVAAKKADEQAQAQGYPGRDELPHPASLALAGLTVLAVTLTVAVRDALPTPAVHFLMCLCTLSFGGMLYAMPVIGRIGENRVVAMLAAASYSFYLIHQPLVGYISTYLSGRMTPFAAFCLTSVVAFPLALGASRVMDRLTAMIFSRPGAAAAATKKAAQPGS